MSSTIPTRSDIFEFDKWDLTQLFTDVSKWQEDFAWLQRTYPNLERWKGRVGDSAQTLAEVLEFEKALELRIERVHHYASLQLAEDSTNNEYLTRFGQVQNLFTKIGETAAFVVPEILAIDDKQFAQFIADPALADWRIKLHKIRRMKPHVLSVPEERLLALGSVALSGYDDTFLQLTDVDMKFGVLIDETGREKPLTQSSFSSFLVKRDHDLRKRAFHQFYAEFRDHQYTLAASLAYSVKADVFHARARHYSSALEAALFPDDVPVAVYDGLVQSVRANLSPLFRYFDLRRRALGLQELHHYDTYVPLVPEIETRFKFDQAVEMVLGALEPLGKEYVDVLAERLRTRLVTPCTAGSRKIRSGFRIMNIRFSWPKLHRRSMRNSSPIICSRRRAIRRCALTSSTGKSMISGAHFSGRQCLLSLRGSFTPSKKVATR